MSQYPLSNKLLNHHPQENLLPVMAVSVPASVAGVLLRAATPGEYSPQPCSASKLTSCQSCDTLWLCLGGLFSMLNLTRKCPSSTPYCNQNGGGTATCKATPDYQCLSSVSSDVGFACTGTGFFPDLDSCQKYYYCESEGGLPQQYQCPSGLRYNSKSKTCQRFFLGRCQTVKCDVSSQNVFAPYPLDDSYYVYCQYDYSSGIPTVKKTYVLSCGTGSRFNAQTQLCEFQCRRVGVYVNTANPSQYFSCSRVGFGWQAKVLTCKKGYIFDEALKRCNRDPDAVTNLSTPEITPTTELSTKEIPSTAELSTPEISSTTDVTSPDVPPTTEMSTTAISSTTELSTPEISPTTEMSTTDITATTEISTTDISSTTDLSTPEITPTTEVSTTEIPSTTELSTPEITSTTYMSTTDITPTSEMSTTEIPSTTELSTPEISPTTEMSTTDITPTTEMSTTDVSSTTDLSTPEITPTTEMSITDITPSTEMSTTEIPSTTDVSTTEIPSTTELSTPEI
ncbi:uncharacterized protein LOC135711636 [Ochlerotatus camptorhynchus]|uniref:uncharacterized protein LOC135711636 n=1 Tax=Ochlerotatus camptorhynchus TaxID=644619 RepID=UPI0031DA4B8B